MLTLTKSPVNSRLTLTRPSSYVIHVTSPLTRDILPLMFRDEARALAALDEVWNDLGREHYQCWLISPMGELLDSRQP